MPDEPLEPQEVSDEAIDAAWQQLFAESAALHERFLASNNRLQTALVAGNGADIIRQMHADAFDALGITVADNADDQFADPIAGEPASDA